MIGMTKKSSSPLERAQGPGQSSVGDTSSPIPFLYPIYLSYNTQHRILSFVQLILEECCFDFATKWLPEMMTAEGWEFAVQAPLTEWTKKIKKHSKALPGTALTFGTSEKSLEEILFATHNLRHAAVHRHRITASRVVELIEHALTLARTLNDFRAAGRIERIRNRLQQSLERLKSEKDLLGKRLSDQIEIIARQRVELDRIEKSAVEDILITDKKNQLSAGLALDQILNQDELEVENGSEDLHNRSALVENGHTNGNVEVEAGQINESSSIRLLNGLSEVSKSTSIVNNAASENLTSEFNVLSGHFISTSKMDSRINESRPSIKSPDNINENATSLNKGPLFTLQLSDSVHSTTKSSPVISNVLDFSKLSFNEINPSKPNPFAVVFSTLPSGPSGNISILKLPSFDFDFSVPGPVTFDLSKTARSRPQSRRKPATFMPTRCSNFYDAATMLADESL